MLKFKNKITAALALIFTVLSCGAMNYQIKYLNTPTIKINQKQLKEGDWFNDNAVINWEKDTQAMRVLSRDNKVYTLSAKKYRESEFKKFSDFIATTKPLAARKVPIPVKDLQDIFEMEYELLDVLHIDLSEVKGLPDGITFLFTSDDDLTEPLSLRPENSILIINRESVDVESSENDTLYFTVKFLIPDSKEECLITPSFELTLLQLAE